MASTVTMTINVKKDVLDEFRSVAGKVYGDGKGHLGKAVAEALSSWASLHKRGSAEERALKLLEKGYHLGYDARKLRREDIYDRR